MLSIILCEDDTKFRNSLVEFLNSYIHEKNAGAHIELITDKPKEVLAYHKKNMSKTNIYFLDIALESSTDGLMLAKEIRKNDHTSYIVFITSFQEFSIKTFQYKLRVSDYIFKGEKNLRERLTDCLELIMKDHIRTILDNTQVITIKSGQTIYNLPVMDIISFQTSTEHKIVVSTVKNQIEFYGTMKDVEHQLNEDFFRIHRSYIINTKYIKKIEKSRDDMHVLMQDGSKCLLSRNYVKGLLSFVENN